jgi:exodeoxyribonuclease V gamma subunit
MLAPRPIPRIPSRCARPRPTTTRLMLRVHRAVTTAVLVEGLARLLAEPAGDALVPEVVAVPTRGVERWLAQRLSHRLGAVQGDGVCANVTFPSPAQLFSAVLAGADGRSGEADPWVPERTSWLLLQILDDCRAEPWCAPVSGYLGGGVSPGRRFATAAKLARLFAAYASARPGMLRDWTDGGDSDGAGGAVPGDLRWQVELWRRLRAAVAAPDPGERLTAVCQTLRAGAGLGDLPPRLSLFGMTRLAAADALLLGALAAGRDVHLWLPHPSPALWQKLAPVIPALSSRRRADDRTGDVVRHPLLVSLGRDVRELQRQLATIAAGDSDEVEEPADRADGSDREQGAEPERLLHRLQASIVADTDLLSPPSPLAPGDRSVQVHACHGPGRQVEVLREVLVGLFADDPTLEPRDVLVMCPDIEDYAALIGAAFGAAEEDTHPGHRLRVRLADRSLRQTNPLLGLLAALLDLAGGRVTASQVLDLAASAPVRRRFRFTDDDLERIRDWVDGAGIRWGLDAEHRAPFRLQRVGQNTWQAGLDRILLGVAMADDGRCWVDRTLPLDDVGSSDVELAGRLAEFLARLRHLLDRLSGPQPLQGWLDALTDTLELLGTCPAGDEWQDAAARRQLSAVRAEAGAGAENITLGLGDVEVLLADRLRGLPTRANFRTGQLTMSSMVPMRSVPHRVVCLLGLDDGRFPRGGGPDGDDLLARSPCIGERDPASEDRQLLLDALLAARERLVVLYTGADPRTNAVRPPAVPLGELLDALDALAVTGDGRPARQAVVVRHPLQPFDRRNFVAGQLGVPRPFSFDRVAADGARRAGRDRETPGDFLTGPLPPAPGGSDVELADLTAFLEHPCRAFLRQRLRVALPAEDGDRPDGIPVELDSLACWQVGQRLLEGRLAGADLGTCQQAEWRRGTLPPGALGQQLLRALSEDVEPLVAASEPFRLGHGRAVDAVVDLAGRRLSGTVAGVHGRTVVRINYSRLAAKHRVRAWVELLALTATRPGEPWQAVSVGRRGPGKVLVSHLGPVQEGSARRTLAELLALFDRGRRAPLPFAAKTSARYAQARAAGEAADRAAAAAATEWAGGTFGERADTAHRMVWGDDADFSVLCRAEPETAGGEPTLFGELARRVFDPLAAAERLDRC